MPWYDSMTAEGGKKVRLIVYDFSKLLFTLYDITGKRERERRNVRRIFLCVKI